MAEVKPTYRELVERWKRLREREFSVREVACEGVARTLLCVEYGDLYGRAVHLSAGVHGDEPAGVVALLELAERGAFDARCSYRIWPCTNPSGYDAGTRVSAEGTDINRTFGRGGSSPEARAVIMSNRDRKFDVALDLHEDDETGEPYAYVYGDVEVPGVRVLRPDAQEEAAALGGLSLSLLLIRNAATRAVTLESDASRPLEERVAWLVDKSRTVLRLL